MKLSIKNTRGFTVVEMLTAIFIFTLITLGATTLFKTVFTGSKQQGLSIDVVDQARTLEFNFVNEMRNATYGVDGSYPLNEASSTQVVFYSNYIGGSTTPNRIRYYLSGSTLYKGLVAPSGSPLMYNTANEVISTAQTGLSLSTTTLFYYYGGNYTGTSTPFTQPVNVTLVKFVRMNLNILKKTTTSTTSVFTVNQGAAIRNIKTNLGN